MMIDDPLFTSVHAALIFAYNYAGQQSPRTPMTRLVQGGSIGSGKGLIGVDGAAQAGMILAAVDRLPADQKNVITARFGDVRTDCRCCGQPAPAEYWIDAVDALSHCDELEGVPRRVRYAAIEKAVCGKKFDATKLSKDFGLSERTLYRQVSILRKRISKIENRAIAQLADFFSEKGLTHA